jgi:hypothetical protein
MSAPKDLGDLLRRAAEEDQRRNADRIAEAQQKLLTTSFDKAAVYTTVIIFGGYAGFFALWQLTKDYLSKDQALWSALLILVSMLAFILFEVFKMIVVTRAVFSKANVLRNPANRHNPLVLLRVLDEMEQAQSAKLGPFLVVWSITVMLAAGGALAGAGVLGYAFVRGLAR